MKPAVVAAAAFLVGSLALGSWVLTRPRTEHAEDAAGSTSSAVPSAEGLFAFAAWSARTDAILLVEIDAARVRSATPKRFHVLDVSFAPNGEVSIHDGAYYSWDVAERSKAAAALRERGFTMTADDPPYPPASDPLSGEAPARRSPSTSSPPGAPAATPRASDVQAIPLRSRGGLTATLRRTGSDPHAAVVWNKRALGFPSADRRYAYVVPDEVIIPLDPAGSP